MNARVVKHNKFPVVQVGKPMQKDTQKILELLNNLKPDEAIKVSQNADGSKITSKAQAQAMLFLLRNRLSYHRKGISIRMGADEASVRIRNM